MLLAMARRQAKMGIAPSQFELQSSQPSGGSSHSGIKEETPGGLKGQKGSAELEQASRNFPEHNPQSPAAGGADGKEPTGEGAPRRNAGGEMAFAAEGTRRVGVAAVQGGTKSETAQNTCEEVLFKCSTCSEVFQVQEQLTEHMGTHPKTAPTKTFGCVCGKFFATYRGLSKHWDYEPGHRPANPTRKQIPHPATSTPAAPPAPPTSLSEPTSPFDLDAPPLQSPTSTPSSPVYTKSLGRNLTYHSIIRTRQSSNVDQSGGKMGSKRPRGTSNSPAAKVDSPESKDSSEGAKREQQKREGAFGSRLRTRSLSGSDNTPPLSMKGTLSSADLVRSPMTRSSSAAMKTVEFVSLPSRKKRRRRTRTGEPQLEESPTSEEPVTPASGRKEMKMEEPPPEPKKVQEPVVPPPQPQQQQPVKRKRGRPPKHRKDPPPPVTITSTSSISSTPSTSATSSPLAMSSQKTTVTSTTTSLGSITSPSVGGEPPMEARPPVQPMEESPLPPSSLEGNMPPEKSALNLPLWESIGHKSQPVSSSTKSEHTSSTQLQSLLSQQPGTKSQVVPELPSVHPSIIPPATSSCAPVIPSILPQLKSDTKDVCSSPSFTAQLPADVITSPTRSNTQCTYVITSKGNKMSIFENTPLVSSSAGSSTTETVTVSKGKPVCKEDDKSDEEPEVIAVEPASSVAIDLTGDDKMEEKEFLGRPQHISRAVLKHKLRREGKDKEKEERKEEEKRKEEKGKEEKGKKEKGKKEKEEEDKKRSDEKVETAVTETEPSTDTAEKQAETGNTDHDKEIAEVKAKEKPVGPQRPPSVFVSVLSGPEKKGERKMEEKSTSDVKPRRPTEMESEAKKLEAGSRLTFTEPSMQMPYPLVSTPTYPYPGPYPPPPPMMFPPPNSPSSMYSPYYGSYPLPPGHYMPPPPPPMGMMPHPPPPPPPDQQSGTSQPHSMSSPFTYATSSSQLPAVTTVGGVRVSILDKPPMQMPTVTVPPLHQIPPSRRPQSVPSSFNAHMDHGPQGPSSVIRSFMNAPSPDGMDMSHPPHSHPLSQAYRLPPGPPPPGYMPPPPHQQSYVSVRLDPTGVPYVDWGPPPPPPPTHIPSEGVKAKAEPSKPTQPEELPSQPVECPECGRLFKNNKALNGHMRLHGGFDWTKKPFTSIPGLSGSGTAPGASKTPRSSSSNGSSNEEGNSEMEDRQPKPKKQRSKKRSRSRSLSPNNKKRRRKSSEDSISEQSTVGSGAVPLPVPRGPNVFTFDTKVEQHRSVPLVATTTTGMQDAGTMTQHRSATLDDLCRAVEELERMENGERNKQGDGKKQEDLEDDSKQRPGNIRIPQSFSTPTLERERHRFGATPPYTPPPILSPSRSMTMLAGFGTPTSQPCTPCRILPTWSSRRTSDNRRPSESDDSYTEPKINVGKEFQATLPECRAVYTSTPPDEHKMVKVWQPLEGTTHEDESVVDGYLELACSPAVLHSGRNKEFAMHLLYQLGGSVKEAVRLLLTGKSLLTPSSEMTDYNYSGTKQWSARERQQFRRAWRVHRKQFHLLRSTIDTKRYHDIIEYYYSWKKYCNDEYRGRNRHHSEDILADDEYPHANSDTSSSGSADNESLPPHLLESRKGEKRHLTPQPSSSLSNSILPLSSQYSTYDHLPIVYAPHTSNPKQTVHQYKCKYPGCNQIFTSIFALNGHIRIHGGSFYPKPSKVESSSSLQPYHQSSASRSLTFTAPSHTFTISSAPPTSSHHIYTHTSSSGAAMSRGPKPHRHKTEYRSQQQLELARALLELPQPRSPAQSAGYHTPSPKPSPGKSKSPGKKKMSSSSPGEHEGYYPCNRCGRVFSKVKSRSAHMKSHIIKQT